MPSEIILVNNPAHFKERRRTKKDGSLGKARLTIEVEAEPIAHNFDWRTAAPTSEAIKEVVQDSIKNITAIAKPATLAARERAKRAFDRGARWARKRYSGGRTGDTPPDPTKVRAFNNSGRLANNLAVRLNSTDKTFTINVPANRFSDDVFPGQRKVDVLQKLSELVPELSQPKRLMNNPKVKAGLKESIDLLMQKLGKTGDAKTAELRRLQLRLAKTALKAFL